VGRMWLGGRSECAVEEVKSLPISAWEFERLGSFWMMMLSCV
jgi:hypothetical protein